MDSESSFLWHGSAWFAGRQLPGSAGSIPGLTADIDLISAFNADETLPVSLPSAVVLDISAMNGLDEDPSFWSWLQTGIESQKTDFPVVFLCGSQTSLPQDTRPHAIVDRAIPDEILFSLICDLQRALMRSEEARTRRISFGRIPGYGAAPHHQGNSGLLVIGMGGRFLQLQGASQRNVEVVGAFDQYMGEHFLAQRAFDAVILDAAFDETLENLRQFRMDPRFASLPVLAVTEIEADIPVLFRAGASDVLRLPVDSENLALRLAAAIRAGKRRRLADKILAESHKWLTRELNTGGVSQNHYDRYLSTIGPALAKRGLEVWEMNLLPENFSTPDMSTMLAPDLYGTLLSIADATSREEDLVCFVHDRGPVAVLKSERGKSRLQARINAILGRTVL